MTDGAWSVIGHAVRRDVDALIITGDLFERYNPSSEIRDSAIEMISHVLNDDVDIPVYFVHGDHDHEGVSGSATPGIDSVCARTHAERLGRTPILLDDIAVYGLHNEELRTFGKDVARQLVMPPEEALSAVLCLHEMHPRWDYVGKPEIGMRKILRQVPFTVDMVACGDVHRKKQWRPLPSCLGRYAGSPSRAVRSNLLGDYEPSAFLYEFSDDGVTTEELVITGHSKRYCVNVAPADANNVDDVIKRVASTVEPPWIDDLFDIRFLGTPDDAILDGVIDRLDEHGVLRVRVWDSPENVWEQRQRSNVS